MDVKVAPLTYQYTDENDRAKSLADVVAFKERGLTPINLAVDCAGKTPSATVVAQIASNLTRYAPKGHSVRILLDFIPDGRFCDEFIENCINIVVPIFDIAMGDVSTWMTDADVLGQIQAAKQSGVKLSLRIPLTRHVLSDEFVQLVRGYVFDGISILLVTDGLMLKKAEQTQLGEFVTKSGLSYLVDFVLDESVQGNQFLHKCVIDAELKVTAVTSTVDLLRKLAKEYMQAVDGYKLSSINQLILGK